MAYRSEVFNCTVLMIQSLLLVFFGVFLFLVFKMYQQCMLLMQEADPLSDGTYRKAGMRSDVERSLFASEDLESPEDRAHCTLGGLYSPHNHRCPRDTSNVNPAAPQWTSREKVSKWTSQEKVSTLKQTGVRKSARTSASLPSPTTMGESQEVISTETLKCPLCTAQRPDQSAKREDQTVIQLIGVRAEKKGAEKVGPAATAACMSCLSPNHPHCIGCRASHISASHAMPHHSIHPSISQPTRIFLSSFHPRTPARMSSLQVSDARTDRPVVGIEPGRCTGKGTPYQDGGRNGGSAEGKVKGRSDARAACKGKTTAPSCKAAPATAASSVADVFSNILSMHESRAGGPGNSDSDSEDDMEESSPLIRPTKPKAVPPAIPAAIPERLPRHKVQTGYPSPRSSHDSEEEEGDEEDEVETVVQQGYWNEGTGGEHSEPETDVMTEADLDTSSQQEGVPCSAKELASPKKYRGTGKGTSSKGSKSGSERITESRFVRVPHPNTAFLGNGTSPHADTDAARPFETVLPSPAAGCRKDPAAYAPVSSTKSSHASGKRHGKGSGRHAAPAPAPVALGSNAASSALNTNESRGPEGGTIVLQYKLSQLRLGLLHGQSQE